MGHIAALGAHFERHQADRAKPPAWERCWEHNSNWFNREELDYIVKQRVRVPDEVRARGDAERKANGVVKGWWYWRRWVYGSWEVSMQAAPPTHNESELSRHAELDAVANERWEWAQCVMRKCLKVLQRKCLEASKVSGEVSGANNMRDYFMYRRWSG